MADIGDLEAAHRLANEPQPPPRTGYLWGYFSDLHQTRTNNGMGPCRLSRLEIRAWQEDEGIPLASWERRAIMALDATWFAFVTEQARIARAEAEASRGRK